MRLTVRRTQSTMPGIPHVTRVVHSYSPNTSYYSISSFLNFSIFNFGTQSCDDSLIYSDAGFKLEPPVTCIDYWIWVEYIPSSKTSCNAREQLKPAPSKRQDANSTLSCKAGIANLYLLYLLESGQSYDSVGNKTAPMVHSSRTVDCLS